MTTDIFNSEGLQIGDTVKAIALCSKVEILQNLTSVGSHRQIYHLHGKDSSYLPGIIFKQNNDTNINTDSYRDEPVLIDGVVGEYKGVIQLHLVSITPIGEQLDKSDLLAEMSNTEVLDVLNDELYRMESITVLSRKHLSPPLGLDEARAGSLPARLAQLIIMTKVYYPEEIAEYVENIATMIEFYMNSEGTFNDRIDLIKTVDSPLIRSLIFNPNENPELVEFVKIHHTILKPKKFEVEIVTNLFSVDEVIN